MKAAPLRAVLLLCAVYFGAGMVFGALAGRAATHQGLVAWRWAAWLVSGIGFGAHIVYEQVRLGSSPRITALHVAAAAGLGAFGLAAAANVHARAVSSPSHAPLLLLSLVLWPVLVAVPAFLIALLAAHLLARLRRSM